MSDDRTSVRVKPYSISMLGELLTTEAMEDDFLDTKQHMDYFESYFSHPDIDAKTIVVEQDYTDRDFLEDYAAYYVRCLDKYPSRCRRLHFFAIDFSFEDLVCLMEGPSGGLSEDVFTDKSNYIGFIVVKPLPQTIIGRTCLRTYKKYPENVQRRYPATKEYEVHLLGFRLVVDSLAFQEQDQATSACATSALWSAFHKTADLFHHNLYSPVEITKRATDRVPGRWRSFPNHGLTTEQMIGAINDIRLEPEVQQFREDSPLALLQGFCYGYMGLGIPSMGLGIPSVLVGSLWNAENPQDAKPLLKDESNAWHAVAVTGFCLGGPCRPSGKYNTLFRHTRIDKLYVHDDQLGPFSRMAVAESLHLRVGCRSRLLSSVSLKCPSQDPKDNAGVARLVPELLIAPVYHKIRISHKWVLADVEATDGLVFENIRRDRPEIIPERIEWDVFLAFGWQVKEDAKRLSFLSPQMRSDLLQELLPRFVWRAIGYSGDANRPLVELLYDATDIETADFTLPPMFYDERLEEPTLERRDEVGL